MELLAAGCWMLSILISWRMQGRKLHLELRNTMKFCLVKEVKNLWRQREHMKEVPQHAHPASNVLPQGSTICHCRRKKTWPDGHWISHSMVALLQPRQTKHKFTRISTLPAQPSQAFPLCLPAITLHKEPRAHKLFDLPPRTFQKGFPSRLGVLHLPPLP